MYRARFSLLVLGSLGLTFVQAARSQPDTSRTHTVTLLSNAMRSRIVVSQDKTGRTIPAIHCRHAVGGCDQRLNVFAQYLVDVSSAHGIDPWLMAAMAFKESGFNPFALGSLGEMGILQINPERRDARNVRFIRDQWYRQRCRKQPGNCQREVVEHAAQVLGRSLERCGGDVTEALGAYNTGRCGGNDRYAKRVLVERGQLRRAAGLESQVATSERKSNQT